MCIQNKGFLYFSLWAKYLEVNHLCHTRTHTFKLFGSTDPWMLFVSKVSRVGRLYARCTSSGAVLRCFARLNDCTEKIKSKPPGIKNKICAKFHMAVETTGGGGRLALFFGIHEEGVLVFCTGVCIQKMELPFQPLNFLTENDVFCNWGCFFAICNCKKQPHQVTTTSMCLLAVYKKCHCVSVT